MSAPVETASVVIVGGGPAGLTAASALAPDLKNQVIVLEREQSTGGIPRHSDHPGYGIRDRHRFMSGPAYAETLTRDAGERGADLRTQHTVTGWAGGRQLEVTSPSGRYTLQAEAVVLATGARERPRPARRIPGDRPAGVFTTGQLQNQVHLLHGSVGKRAVVVGAELVSWSAVVTLREAGCSTVGLVSAYDKSEAYTAFRLGGRVALRAPVIPRSRVVRINGRQRVTSVEIENLDTRERQLLECDTVVMTGDWIPDHELARLRGIELDHATRGPRVDSALRTSAAGVFAAGNLIHPVDTADVAALDGRHVADQVRAHLSGTTTSDAPPLEIVAGRPFRWVTPQLYRSGDPAPSRGRLLLWSDDVKNVPVVTATQRGDVVGSVRSWWPAAPGRVFRVPFTLLRDADPHAGPVTISL